MPSLGPDMESGTLVEWRMKPGDSVKRGDVVALVETDKGVIDVEIFAEGTVEALLVQPGAHVPVGTVLAQLSGEPSLTSPSLTSIASTQPSGSEPLRPVTAAAAPVPVPTAAAQRQKISPAARARARQLGVDVTKLTGSGPGGVVTLEDVARLAAAVAAPPAAAAQPHDMRQVIAKAMTRSKREIPHYYLSLACSFAAARAFIGRYNATVDIEQRLLPSALLLKSVALAARALPDFNGFYKDGEFFAMTHVHVGMAIAMRGGRLAAPAILDADTKSLQTVMSELRDLATRVRAGHMRATELSSPTITLTSLADDGADLVVPAIYPPQVAIVGCGSIADRPWVVDGAVRPEPVVTITVAADHRVTDGRCGAKFLARIRDALLSPEKL